MTTEADDLIARLRAKEATGYFEGGRVLTEIDGKCIRIEGEPILRLVNPDGPEAADLIERLSTPTPRNQWGAKGFEVAEAEDVEERPDPRLRWLVHANGVGSFPVAWFYEKADADHWCALANGDIALSALQKVKGEKP